MMFCRHPGWSRSAGPNCSRFREMAATLNLKNRTCTFLPVYFGFLVIPTKLGRDIASRGHLVHEFDLQRPWPLEKWWPFLGSEITFFELFSKSIRVIWMKLGRDIASCKGYLVCEIDLERPWPCEFAAILRVWNHIFYIRSHMNMGFYMFLIGLKLPCWDPKSVWRSLSFT